MTVFQDELLQFSPVFFIVLDAENRVVMMNDHLLKTLGYLQKDTYGKTFLDSIVPSGCRGDLSITIEKCIVTRHTVVGESYLRMKDGGDIPVEWHFRPVFRENGEFDSIIGTGIDLTNQMMIKRQLLESENRYRSLFHHNPAPMLLLDPAAGRILDANPAAGQFYGYALEALTSMKVTELNTLSEQEVRKEMASALSREKNRFRFIHRLADGTERSVEVLSHPIEIDGGTYLYSTIYDISDRKRMEEELLREREEQLLLFDSLPLIIFFKNLRNRYIRVNRAFCEFFGLSKKQVEGSTAWELFPESAEKFLSDDIDVIESGRPKHSILNLVETAQGIRWLQSDKVPFYDEKGRIIGIVGYSTDITEPKVAGEAIHALVESAVDPSRANVFDRIAERMGGWLATSTVMVARRIDGITASVLSIRIDGEPVSMKDFDITGTPVAEIIDRGFVCRHEGVMSEFPLSERIFPFTAEGFVGISITDSAGTVMGFLCAWSRGRLVLPNRAEEVMRIFASKAYAEIERMRSENALRESEERYRTLVETSPDAIVMMGFDGSIQMMSRQTALMLGFESVEDVMRNGGVVFEFIVPEDRQRVKETLTRLVPDSIKATGAFDIRRSDGSRLPVEVSASLIKNIDGEPVAIIAIIRDITERKVAEQKLIEKHNHLEAMLRNERMLSEIAATINSAETLNMVIGRIEEIITGAIRVAHVCVCRCQNDGTSLEPYGGCGYSIDSGEVSSLCALFLEHPEFTKMLGEGKIVMITDTAMIGGPAGENIHTKGIGSCAMLSLAVGGVEKGVIMFSRKEPSNWSKGEGDLFRIIADMISNAIERDDNFMARLDAEKRHAEVLRMAERSSRLASIGTLAAGISHEINQPLTALKVKVDSLLYWGEMNQIIPQDDLTNDLAFISQQAERIDDIIKHMRALARQEKGNEPVEIDINQIIGDVLSLLRQQISAHGIRIVMDLDGELPHVKGHRTLMHQVIINLIVNAIHALDEKPNSLKTVMVRTGVHDGSVIIEVSDNGPGIALENLNQLFDPFFTTKIGGEGLGIGLSICHNIITGLGGVITAGNRPEGGAVFKVSIPRIPLNE